MAVLQTLSLLLAVAASSVNPMPLTRRDQSPPADYDGCTYNVTGVGNFNTLVTVDFTQTSTLPSWLEINTYTVAAGYQPYARQFSTDNIVFNPGDSMSMLVPGNQSTDPISSAQVATIYDDILYGSVRTVAKASPEAGTVHGE